VIEVTTIGTFTVEKVVDVKAGLVAGGSGDRSVGVVSALQSQLKLLRAIP
jgi:hypothetical protein